MNDLWDWKKNANFAFEKQKRGINSLSLTNYNKVTPHGKQSKGAVGKLPSTGEGECHGAAI